MTLDIFIEQEPSKSDKNDIYLYLYPISDAYQNQSSMEEWSL